MIKLKKAIFRYKNTISDEIFGLNEAQKVLIEILDNFSRFCEKNDIEYSLTYGSLIGAKREGGFIPWDDDVDLMMTRENFEKVMSSISKLNEFDLCAYHYSFTKNIYTNEIRVYKKGYYRILENNGKKYLTPLCIDIFPFDKITIFENKKDQHIQNKVLEKITKSKKTLILKEAKYNSKSRFRSILRFCKKILYIFVSSKSLHKMIDANIKKTYAPGCAFEYYSPFANESFLVRFTPETITNLEEVSFSGIKTFAIKDYDTFLTKVYGDWKKPIDRSNGKVNNVQFLKRNSELR